MRRWTLPALLGLIGLIGCGESGLRDRSLARTERREASLARRYSVGRRVPTRSSVIGLVSDPMARFYAEKTSLVIRFNDMTSLLREVSPRLREVSRLLPQLRLPRGSPAALLRRVLKLPSSVVFDPLRPFALVKTGEDWVGILPTRSHDRIGSSLRSLDGIYSVAGDPAVVAAYRPGFRKGFFLPGDCSVLVKPAVLPRVGTELSNLFDPLDLDLEFLDGALGDLPSDIDRVDLALQFSETGLRLDLRLAPGRNSLTAKRWSNLHPRSSDVARWLPPDGSLYWELGPPPSRAQEILAGLWPRLFGFPPPEEEREQGWQALRTGLGVLDGNTAAMLDLDPDGSGRLFFICSLEKTQAARTFLTSDAFTRLLEWIAGPRGHLELTPDVFAHGGVNVDAITGHISRKRLNAWRQQGVVRSTLGTLLRGPVVAYIALAGNALCIVAGERARSQTERFLDAVLAGKPGHNEHAAEVDRLFRRRLASASANLAALFDGSREAAPFWHPNGRTLRRIALRWRLPVAAAATVEGDAMRISLHLPPRRLADAAAKILRTLRTGAKD